MPRHPPCALHSLSHKHSTKTTKTLTPPPRKAARARKRPDQVLTWSQMLASTIQFTNNTPTNPRASQPANTDKGSSSSHQLPDPSKPNSVPKPTPPQQPPGSTPAPPKDRQAVLRRPCDGRGRSSTIPLVNTTNANRTDAGCAGRVLLRKEVIQPHLPVRLPCYDFVPIASPTFDGSPHKG